MNAGSRGAAHPLTRRQCKRGRRGRDREERSIGTLRRWTLSAAKRDRTVPQSVTTECGRCRVRAATA
eukprot:281180-Chlamydomonas_euryale.AAC.1